MSLVVVSLRPRWVFCGRMHHKAQHRVGATEILCLSDFHRDSANAFVMLDIG